MPEYSFTRTEHDPNRPWIVVEQQHDVVELDDGVSFFEWARQTWPEPRFTVELDPYQLGR